MILKPNRVNVSIFLRIVSSLVMGLLQLSFCAFFFYKFLYFPSVHNVVIYIVLSFNAEFLMLHCVQVYALMREAVRTLGPAFKSHRWSCR